MYEFHEYFLNCYNTMDFKKITKNLEQSIINKYGLNASYIMFFSE